uniref:GTP-binding protein Rhes n=2 Tax=Trichogramma TaxID=7490 RepID=A0ABD2WXA2_9HYME
MPRWSAPRSSYKNGKNKIGSTTRELHSISRMLYISAHQARDIDALISRPSIVGINEIPEQGGALYTFNLIQINCVQEITVRRAEALEVPEAIDKAFKLEYSVGIRHSILHLKERIMMGRFPLKRRLSLQPSSVRNNPDDDHRHSSRSSQRGESAANGGKPIKVIVLGLAKVGKTALIYQFLYNQIPDKYKATVDDTHKATFNAAKDKKIAFEILDTSGSLEFPAMLDLSIKQYDVFVLVYDASEPSTFKKVKELREQIMRTKDKAPIVVVANKIDICEDKEKEEIKENENIVTKEWGHGFVNTSAKENKNTWNVFQELLKQANIEYDLRPALNKRRQSLPPPQHNSRASIAQVSLTQAQLQHLEKIRENSDRGADKGRNSCSVS